MAQRFAERQRDFAQRTPNLLMVALLSMTLSFIRYIQSSKLHVDDAAVDRQLQV